MKVLIHSTSFNSMTQHAYVQLQELGHEVSVVLAVNKDSLGEAVALFEPDLIVCPFLTKFIAEDIWKKHTCIVLHPGIKGDRGPSSLDWAILNEETHWGVTALEASEHADAGDVWSTYHFEMRKASKSSLYRAEVIDAGMKALVTAVRRFEAGLFVPAPLNYSDSHVKGQCRPMMKQAERAIDWAQDDMATVMRKIRSADSNPGLLDVINGQKYYLYGAHEDGQMIGKPGSFLGQRHGAVCRAVCDGAIWISHMKRRPKKGESTFKVPAMMALDESFADLPELPLPANFAYQPKTFQEIWYEETQDIGVLGFRFYNGAMSTEQCQRLRDAYCYAKSRPTKMIVMLGGRDFWSNGIHLNTIEAAESPADESWANINAIDDLILEMLTDTKHYTIAALHGSAGAGGVMLALAADKIIVREGITLNPHYKGMGGLYGSEYWTYTLPKRVGAEKAEELTNSLLPLSAFQALDLGLVDDVLIQDEMGSSVFTEQIKRISLNLRQRPDFDEYLTRKAEIREEDEAKKPLAKYREEELAQMKINFYGEDQSYHKARHAFVHKHDPCRTPAHLATYLQD